MENPLTCEFFGIHGKIHNGHTCALPYMDKTDMHMYMTNGSNHWILRQPDQVSRN